jgi:hypothetical protein
MRQPIFLLLLILIIILIFTTLGKLLLAGIRSRIKIRRKRLGSSGETTKVLEGIKAGAVTIGPARLERIAADELPAGQLETGFGIAHVRPIDVAQYVRLAATGSAGTRASQTFQQKIGLIPVIPPHGELFADELNVF